jgi:hypothetical protein
VVVEEMEMDLMEELAEFALETEMSVVLLVEQVVLLFVALVMEEGTEFKKKLLSFSPPPKEALAKHKEGVIAGQLFVLIIQSLNN